MMLAFLELPVALDLHRSFWEQATILHAEHHRPPVSPLKVSFLGRRQPSGFTFKRWRPVEGDPR